MLWALATQNQELLTFLQTQKFTKLIDYYAALPGGGSREGTGYGTAQGSLFVNYLYWKASTGENLAALTSHTRDTIDYWVHATVPTRNRFAPIGDQSRSSQPEIYDYHENLVHTAVVLSPGTDQARRGVWWLQNNSIGPVTGTFNAWGDLLPYPVTPLVPAERAYHARGVGAFFARSGWEHDASWFALVAGPYDQSHAHHDQGSITFYKNDWLVVTSNIWSHSGIHQEDEEHNVLRFTRANGSTIAQNAQRRRAVVDDVYRSGRHRAGERGSVERVFAQPAVGRELDARSGVHEQHARDPRRVHGRLRRDADLPAARAGATSVAARQHDYRGHAEDRALACSNRELRADDRRSQSAAIASSCATARDASSAWSCARSSKLILFPNA